jgi:thioredoxin reductase
MVVNDVIVIGAGIAGISATVQLKRYGFNPLLVERNEIGGLILNANLIENYPGLPAGINGIEFKNLLLKHLEKYEINVCFENVMNVRLEKKIYLVETDKNFYKSKFIVIASGTKPVKLFIKGKEFPKTIYEVYPLRNEIDKNIIIIGGGDAAFDYAVNLCKNNNIFLLNKNSDYNCINSLWKSFLSCTRINYFSETEVESVENQAENIIIFCYDKKNNNKFDLVADYMVAAVGREPNNDFLSENLKMSLSEIEDETIFFAGDVRNGIYRQASISAGDGIKTAMKIAELYKTKTKFGQ